MSLKEESLSNCHFRHLGRLLPRHFLSLLGPHLLIQKSNVFISRSKDEPKLLLLSYLLNICSKVTTPGNGCLTWRCSFCSVSGYPPCEKWPLCLNRQSLGCEARICIGTTTLPPRSSIYLCGHLPKATVSEIVCCVRVAGNPGGLQTKFFHYPHPTPPAQGLEWVRLAFTV